MPVTGPRGRWLGLGFLAALVVAAVPGSGATADDAPVAPVLFSELSSCPGGRILDAFFTLVVDPGGGPPRVPEEPEVVLDAFERDTGLDLAGFDVVRADLGRDEVRFHLFSAGDLVASVLALRTGPWTWGLSEFSACSDLTDAATAGKP